jgi:large subunit ribosomal protein L14
MIQDKTLLNVIDNSGAQTVCCIKVMKGYRRRYAYIGDVITVSVKSIRRKRKLTSKVKKGDVAKALIIRTKITKTLPFHEHISFNENSVVLINKQNKLLGTRVFGPVPKSFKYSRFLRIASLSAGIIK